MKQADVAQQTGDELIRFLLPAAQTRGAIIRGSRLRAAACRAHGLVDDGLHTPGELFGQALVASVLLLSISKGGVRQVLQLDGKQAPITRILAETKTSDTGGNVRGYVEWNEGVSTLSGGSTQLSGSPTHSPTNWLGSPVNISTVRDPGFGQPYVSSVQSKSEFLADMLVDYMNQSVQIRADVVLHGDTGLLIEAMPGSSEEVWFSAVEAMAKIPNEALEGDPEAALAGFASLGMQIVGRDTYRWHCDCDSAAMARALGGMDPASLEDLKDENGRITVSCRYCGATHFVEPGKD